MLVLVLLKFDWKFYQGALIVSGKYEDILVSQPFKDLMISNSTNDKKPEAKRRNARNRKEMEENSESK